MAAKPLDGGAALQPNAPAQGTQAAPSPEAAAAATPGGAKSQGSNDKAVHTAAVTNPGFLLPTSRKESGGDSCYCHSALQTEEEQQLSALLASALASSMLKIVLVTEHT